MNPQHVQEREARYLKYWEREPDFILHPTDSNTPHIDVYRFPPNQRASQLADAYSYITAGMSDQPMPTPRNDSPSRIELTAFSKKLYRKGPNDDFLASILLWMGRHAFEEKTYYWPWQTFNVGKPLVSGSEMSAYFFTETPIIEANGLFDSCPTAEGFVHLVPISEAERNFIIEKGREEMFQRFAERDVGPYFDLERKSVV